MLHRFIITVLLLQSVFFSFCLAGEPTQPDRTRFEQLLKVAQQAEQQNLTLGQTVVLVGLRLLDTAYVGGTLDGHANETLVLNLDGLDCVTFCENVIALAAAPRLDQGNFNAFKHQLTLLRYRQGTIDGYLSRLHYTTDWTRTAVARGLLKDLTKDLGGKVDQRPISFMSTHHDKYAGLKTSRDVSAIQQVEANLNQQPRYYLPKAHLASVESRIPDGAMLGLSTNVKGLDIAHTGFAVKVGARLHMLHASSSHGKVEITKLPLADYLAGKKHLTGLTVHQLQLPHTHTASPDKKH